MTRPGRTIVALGLSVVGFAASIASAIDYMAPEPTFCAESGCATVRASAWAHPLGIPMPILGVGFFAMMIALAFVSRPRLRKVLAISGGVWAIGLIALQAFSIGAWCKLCLVVDPTAIALATVVAAGAGTMRLAVRPVAFAGAAMAATIAVLVAWTRPEEPVDVSSPISIQQLTKPTAVVPMATAEGPMSTADGTTIVEYVDFECPFCRAMAKKLTQAISDCGKPVHVVRKMVPLPIHKHALVAALAWCCADELGKGDEMAEALFTADPSDLTPEGCEKIATDLGLSVEAFRAKLPAARARVNADLSEANAVDVHYLPTLEVGGQRLVGNSATIDQLAQLIRG